MSASQLKKLRPKPNYLLSILSVSIVLFLVGIFLFLTVYSNKFVQLYKEHLNIIVELKDDVNPEKVDRVKQYLAQRTDIKPGSINYIPKDKGLEIMKKEMGEDFLLKDMPNPLFDVFSFNPILTDLSDHTFENIKRDVQANMAESVSDVYYQSAMFDNIIGNLNKIGSVILIISLLIVFIAFILIHNVNKLALYSNRFLIKNMELAGATWGFIIRPFLSKSIWHGLVSGVIAVAGLILLVIAVYSQAPEVFEVVDYTRSSLIALILVLTGIFITLTSTYFVIRKYLSLRSSQLY